MQLKDRSLFRSQAYVNGKWVDADSGATFAVTNPATGETLARVPRMGAPETRCAIEAAQAAYAGWRARTGKERAMTRNRMIRLVTVLGCALVAAGAAACLPPPPPGNVVVVERRPPPPTYEIVEVAPAPGYVWIEGYWTWVGSDWVWVRGRWAAPPYGSRRWERGRWRHVRGGWYWVDGRWR